MRMFKMVLATATLTVGLAACQDRSADTQKATLTSSDDSEESIVGSELDANSLVDTVQSQADLSTLASALVAAKVDDMLSGETEYTLFAPNNEAFKALGKEQLDTLTSEAGEADLKAIIATHVVEGRIDAAKLKKLIEDGGGSATITTAAGAELTAKMVGEDIVLTDAANNQAKVLRTDLAADNGMVHVVDTVLKPATDESAANDE